MRFTHSQNTLWRLGVGAVPRAWVDYGLGHQESIIRYLNEKIRIWDADTAGDVECDFLFEDGQAFRLRYEWSLNVFGEVDPGTGEECPWVMDDYYIEPIDAEQAQVPDRVPGRIWI